MLSCKRGLRKLILKSPPRVGVLIKVFLQAMRDRRIKRLLPSSVAFVILALLRCLSYRFHWWTLNPVQGDGVLFRFEWIDWRFEWVYLRWE